MEVTRLNPGTYQRNSVGFSDRWTFHVCDIGGEPESRRERATQASQIPKYGDAHPFSIPGVRVTNITADYDGDELDQVIVTVDFSGDSSGQVAGLEGTGIKGVEVSSSTLTVTSTNDVNGDPMIITYTGDEVVIPGVTGGAFSAGTEAQTVRAITSQTLVQADFDVSAVTVVVTREMPTPSHLFSKRHATRTNSGNWSGLGPNQWICLGVDSNLNDVGTYDWRYVFGIAPSVPNNDTWLIRSQGEDVILRQPTTEVGNTIDPATGQATQTTRSYLPIRFNNTLGNGIEFFSVYEPIDFSAAFGFEIPGS